MRTSTGNRKLTRSKSIDADDTEDQGDVHIWDRWIQILCEKRIYHFPSSGQRGGGGGRGGGGRGRV